MDDANNLMDVNFTDLDLNQEPIDPPTLNRVTRVGSVLNELETAHGRIEERIRQLEAVSARARQRQRWRQARNTTEIDHFSVGVDGNVLSLDGNTVERTPGRGKGFKRDSSHLVAKALEMDSEVKKAEKEGGSFYDCNICLELANEPVLTCCGHLFCWACFYQVSYIDSTSKECPVCKGEVSDSTVTPIYGEGSGERVYESESGMKIPPRPKARRVESVRQQRVAQGLSHVPVAEALRRIRISIGAMGEQTQQQIESSGVLGLEAELQEGQNLESTGSGRIRIHQVSRVLSESASSLSSLSSALSNAERLVEDLETVINNRFVRNDSPNPFTRLSQSNNQTPNLNPVVNASLPSTSPPQATDVSGSVLRILALRSSSEVSVPVAPSSSQRRRTIITRSSDVDSRDTRESRRRRLN
ncbi:hypothetical protein ACJIZ3_016303 [Penstemon smallii]|uniref:E3 ubiquitin-protein ligase RMA n=1 Tax=Penstemon smallii TaxID=265156 RepID=A0ABD3RQ19_9LAMI